MDISTLEQVFPEDQFRITNVDDFYTLITTKGERKDEECAKMDMNGQDELEIYMLSRCGISGSETLKKIEEYASRKGIKRIKLFDASEITICGKPFNLAILKILTKGESWYNSLGYRSIRYEMEKLNNEWLIKKDFKGNI